MCIRSKQDAITAWCAAVWIRIASLFTLLSTLPISLEPSGEKEPKIQSSVRVIYSGLVSRHPLFCTHPLVCLILITLLTLCFFPRYTASAVVLPDHTGKYSSMENKEISFNLANHPMDYSFPQASTSHRRDKRAHRDRHPLSSEVISYVCDELTDSCKRAAFLRRHIYHNLCVTLPLLYLLPHIGEILSDSSDNKPICNGTYMGLKLRNTDILYDRFLNTPQVCRHSLETLDDKIKTTIQNDVLLFSDLLKQSFCSYADRPSNRTGDFDCNECQEAYSSWICSSFFPIHYPISNFSLTISLAADAKESWTNSATQAPTSLFLLSQPNLTQLPLATTDQRSFPVTIVSSSGDDPHLRILPDSLKPTEKNLHRLVEVRACSQWCTDVETLCPYLNPDDASSNGGEPTFLCDESHYQYVQHAGSSRSGYDCEHDCCFTAEDVNEDLNDEPPIHFTQRDDNSELPNNSFDNTVDTSPAYTSLAKRCIQEQFSKRLETAAADESTISSYYDNITLQHWHSFLSRRSSSAVFDRAPPYLLFFLFFRVLLYK